MKYHCDNNLTNENKKQLLAITMVMTLTLTSCTKEEIDLENQSIPNEVNFSLKNIPNTETISFELPDNGRSQGEQVTMLSFNTIEDFFATSESLEQAIEAHEDAFVTQYDYLSDDELDDMEETIGFDTRLPLRNFQETRSFSNSLFNEFETREALWLGKSELVEEEDPETDILFDVEEMVLLNMNHEVMIGGKVFNFGRPQFNYEITGNFATSIQKVRNDEDVSDDPNINATLKSSSSCTTWRSKNDFDPFSSNRRVKRIVTIRGIPWYTKTKAKIVSYKKRRGKWRRSRIRLGVGLQKNLKWSCNTAVNRTGYKSKSRKRRKQRKVTMVEFEANFFRAQNGSGVIGDYYYSGNTTYKALSW